MTHDDIISAIEEDTGSKPVESYDTEDNKEVDWESSEEMKKSGVIDSTVCKYFDLRYTIFGGKCVCRIEYAVFNEIGYVRWIRVSDRYQGNGLGSMIWDLAISDMRDHGANLIYTKAVASGTRIIAENDKFNQSKEMGSPWLSKRYTN